MTYAPSGKSELNEIPYTRDKAIELLELNNQTQDSLDTFFDKVDGVFYLTQAAVWWKDLKIKELKN